MCNIHVWGGGAGIKCCSLGGNSNYRRIVINPATKRVLGLVEMTCGLVHASYSLPEWQAVKLTFFAPCCNPLSCKSDQHQYSPNNINTLSRQWVMRIYKMLP